VTKEMSPVEVVWWCKVYRLEETATSNLSFAEDSLLADMVVTKENVHPEFP
jgi:hypothetical protein